MSFKPEGFTSITPYLIVDGAAGWIDFVKKAFDAAELSRYEEAGRIVHAHVRIGDAVVEVSDSNAQWKARPTNLHLYVEDARAVYLQAIGAGASSLYEPSVKPYGDLESGVTDAWGNQWFIATHGGSWK